jgi:hypothetical protein
MRIHASHLAIFFASVTAVATLRADWTGVAATAAIDEGDLGKVVFNNDGSAEIRSTISSTSAKLRLTVPETPSLRVPNPKPDEVGSLVFAMRVRDNGPAARVIATLKRVTVGYFIDRPSTVVAATIDSDQFDSPSDGWTTAWANASHHYSSSCCWIRNPQTGVKEGLDFFDVGYFVEVQLIKNSAEGNPGVMSVAILRDQP